MEGALGRTPVRVLVADDDPVVREALAAMVGDHPALELAGITGCPENAVLMAVHEHPDVALVDVRTPGQGATVVGGIRRRSPHTRVIALAPHDERTTILAMLEAGAVGYLVKDAPAAMIVDAIIRAAAGYGSLSSAAIGQVMEEVVAQRAERRHEERRQSERLVRIRHVIDDDRALTIVLQPICSLQEGRMVGAEALSRFSVPPRDRPPERWFADATDAGVGGELEMLAVERALTLLPLLPPAAYLSVNVSPATVELAEFAELLRASEPKRLVVEITERAPIENYPQLNARLSELRVLGVRLAIDDAGAGFASMQHIVELIPDLIKLDRTLIAGIETDPPRQALAAGLISFADHLGATIVAEGIEREGQLAALRDLGVGQGQGFYLCHPRPPHRLRAAHRAAMERRLRRALAVAA
jgi:EAL domain-containing protein (putative c-di-GMP-specific phosphodiesterase class I)